MGRHGGHPSQVLATENASIAEYFYAKQTRATRLQRLRLESFPGWFLRQRNLAGTGLLSGKELQFLRSLAGSDLRAGRSKESNQSFFAPFAITRYFKAAAALYLQRLLLATLIFLAVLFYVCPNRNPADFDAIAARAPSRYSQADSLDRESQDFDVWRSATPALARF